MSMMSDGLSLSSPCDFQFIEHLISMPELFILNDQVVEGNTSSFNSGRGLP